MQNSADGIGSKMLKKIMVKTKKPCKIILARFSEPAGARTQDPRLKRALLYQLSYGFSRSVAVVFLGGIPLIANAKVRCL